jgi:(1->4)-alpha-D-glucan 1-alpha-D-glucosylmutase
MLATSTHDNKRSEDVRARIDVISEMPSAWRRALARWSRINRHKKLEVGGSPAPSRNDEYLLYQTLLGCWPLEPMDEPSLEAFRERIQRYMKKAAREAKVSTSWLNPDEDYERALASFIDALLRSLEGNAFLADFLPLEREIAHFGLANGLAQTAIKLTSPGVPDIYQGNELWDFSLVDPDNRRSVDYARRAVMLQDLHAAFDCAQSMWREKAARLLERIEDGRAKLYVTWRLLSLRKRCAQVFAEGGYVPLLAEGSKAEHVCAFARTHASGTVITVAPRLIAKLCGETRWPLGSVWADTRVPLPEGVHALRNELTGEELEPEIVDGQASVRLAEVLSVFPVAVLACGAKRQ